MKNNFKLPKDYRPYIDKYFLRSKEILQKENLNPIVKYQVFIRQGNCKVYGINEAIAILCKYSDIEKTGHIWSLDEGDKIANGEPLMIIEGPIQSIIDLETMYLGVLAGDTTIKNDGYPNYDDIKLKVSMIKALIKDRTLSYFGARHWRWDYDQWITKVCAKAGADSCSTDIGAINFPKPNNVGIGTIPHSLEAIFHWKYGIEKAVHYATYAFNKHMPLDIPRIALIDYANREIRDTFEVSRMVDGIRIDTCGENYMQGVNPANSHPGVSIDGVYIINQVLKDTGKKIILSSGFADPRKVLSFVSAERSLGKLFDSIGAGKLYNARVSTSDIIEICGQEIHKVGRPPKKTDRLKKIF